MSEWIGGNGQWFGLGFLVVSHGDGFSIYV